MDAAEDGESRRQVGSAWLAEDEVSGREEGTRPQMDQPPAEYPSGALRHTDPAH